MTELSFSAMWRNLRARGWRYQPPRGISTITKYYTPNGWANKANAERRVDVFWGEDELLRFVPEQDALEPPSKRPKSGNGSPTVPPTPLSTPVAHSPHLPVSRLTAPARARSSTTDKSPSLATSASTSSFTATPVSTSLPTGTPTSTPTSAAVTPAQRVLPMTTPARYSLAPTRAHRSEHRPRPRQARPPSSRAPVRRSTSPPSGPPDVSATEDGIFLESGDEEDYSVDDEVSDDDSIFLPDGNDCESCTESDDGTIPDAVSEEPSDDDPDLLRLLYASASAEALSKSDLRLHTLKGWDVHMDDSSHDVQLSAAQLSQDQAAPSDTAEAIGLNLEGLFFLMLPKVLWVTIADASNAYQRWQRNFSPDQLAAWNQRRRARNPAFRPMSATQRQREMARFKEIQPYELVKFIGLLCARALCPHRGKLSRHWATNAHGAVPKGTFGKYMARHRFEEIIRYLHFSSNDAPEARRVKIWKIKPVADVINKTFRSGMTVGPRIAFDEGMIPMRSRFNPMRQYLKAKPHPWGTKCYMTCDSATGYCFRAEIYQGREAGDRQDLLPSENSVLRDIYSVLQGQRNRLIITDRFYTSVLLSSLLLDRGLYHVGTIRTDRLGFCTSIVYKKKEPRSPRGSYRIAQSRVFSNMAAVTWMDNKPVYFLATGCSTALTTVGRRNGSHIDQVPAPQLVRDYNEGMGGADTHDQKRLQRFSIQRSVRLKKYYHTIFVGLVDMALVNMYIIYSKLFARKYPDKPVPTHCQFMEEMQMTLLGVGPSDFEGDISLEAMFGSPSRTHARPRSAAPARHELEQVESYRTVRVGESTQRKRRQYACKVCSILRRASHKPAWETTYICRTCSNAHGGGVIYLCQRARQHDPSGPVNTATCSQIWHDMWRNGTDTPEGVHYRRRAPQDGRRSAEASSAGTEDSGE